MFARRFLLAFVPLIVGCSTAATGPGDSAGALRLEATIGRAVLSVGDTTTLVMRLVNSGAHPISLTFGSSCQVMPYIRDAETDQLVLPSDGSWGCLAVITELTVPAHDAHVVRVALRGGAPQPAIYTETAIAVGRYVAVAEVRTGEHTLRSQPVAFTVR